MATKLKHKTIPYAPAHKQDLMDLLDSKPFKQEIWDWQFTENPGNERFDPVVLVDRWGTIIGYNGIMPARIQFDDRIIQALWSCDFVVDNRYQGKGCGKAIKNELHKRAPLIMALGISDKAAPVLLRMGWQKNDVMDTFRKRNRVPDIKSGLIAGIQLLNRFGKRRWGHPRADVDIVCTETLPEADRINRLWEKVAPTYRRIVVRDYPYLHWRYESHPLVQYQFITAWRDEELAGLIVIRIADSSAHLVDYLGPSRDYDLKRVLLEEFLSMSTQVDYLSCSTSDDEWKQILHDNGFYKQPGTFRFYIYCVLDGVEDALSNWFVMGGDSDGDMLRAGEEGPFRRSRLKRQNSRSRIRIRELTEAEFLESKKVWETLVEESDADPLFLGWSWQSLWWRQWGTKSGFHLYLLGAYTEDSKLVGLAPLYKIEKQLHPLYQYTQLQFIGSTWGGIETVRTEYLDFIVHRMYGSEVRQMFIDYLDNDDSWDQLILSDLYKRSITYNLLSQKSCFKHDYTRIVHTDTGISIDVSGLLDEYLACMGSNTRYNAFNQRKRLYDSGTVSFDYADTETINTYLDRLNILHLSRWGKPCFPKESQEFHTKLAAEFCKTGNLNLSMISKSGKPISVLYDIRVGDREYNIQAGFDSSIDRKLSPGFLHLGYAIESAFNSSQITTFDLLAGSGKNTFYKSHFGSSKEEFITLQINRTPYMKSIYGLYDKLPRFMKNLANTRVFSR